MFYEFYSTNDKGPNMENITNLLEIMPMKHFRKKDGIHCTDNPVSCGFPISACNKNIKLMLQNDYTVVIVNEVSDFQNIIRDVTTIYEPTGNIIYVGTGYQQFMIDCPEI
jgi:hypothetical protein